MPKSALGYMAQNQQGMEGLTRGVYRLVWFFADGAFNQGAVLARLLETSRGLFNGHIQALPLPPEAPAEIPRISLRNAEGNHFLHSSPDRITLERVHEREAPIRIIEDDLRLVSDLFTVVRQIMAARISRIAYIRESMFERNAPAMSLVNYFCRPELASRETKPPGPLSRCENFEIHAHKKYQIEDGVLINSWMRCKTAVSARDARTVVLSVEQDLNTLAEEAANRNFQPADAVRILRSLQGEAVNVGRLYFPHGVPT